jgi:hypothetical protein
MSAAHRNECRAEEWVALNVPEGGMWNTLPVISDVPTATLSTDLAVPAPTAVQQRVTAWPVVLVRPSLM